MYLNRSTIHNINILKKRGVHMLDVEKGELASGLYGFGRMCDIKSILIHLEKFLSKSMPFFGKRILITAGPTYEKIDAVRFIGNYSSGKMGCQLAKKAASYGAVVDLVLGPSLQNISHPLINVFNIESAADMLNICEQKFQFSDISIFSAAVSDFKPIKIIDKKIKKKPINIKTELNKDIILKLSENKKNQFIVGFALETDNEDKNAINKLIKKDMDLIILNSLNNKKSCFGHDTNQIKIIDRDLSIEEHPLMNKSEVATIILDKILFKMDYSSIQQRLI